MALNPASWGPKIAAAVKALGISNSAAITDAQLEAIWTAVATEHDTEISTNLEATGVANVAGGSSAGPQPVTIPPGGAD